MLVDVVVIVLVAFAALRGWRSGAVAQILAIAGFFIGLSVGAALIVFIVSHVHGQIAKVFTAIALLLVPASVIGSVTSRVGIRLGRIIRRVPFGRIDSVIGATVSVAATLVVCWLLAAVLVNTNYTGLAQQIEASHVVREVQTVMPPVPDAFASVERYLSTGGFPQVLVNILPESIAPVSEPSDASLQAGSIAGAKATVKIIAIGCGDQQEGSGFVAATIPSGELIVTNAHVVAGTTAISVDVPDGTSTTATVVLFDPRFDLAVLKTKPLGITPLDVDDGYVNRGTAAIELGYPEGGPYTARKAGIISRFAAEGRDIYDRSLTVRTVYELQSEVRPGNSGGPLVSPSGVVEGVVFSRSASDSNVGFALASPDVMHRIDAAKMSYEMTVSTQGCTS